MQRLPYRYNRERNQAENKECIVPPACVLLLQAVLEPAVQMLRGSDEHASRSSVWRKYEGEEAVREAFARSVTTPPPNYSGGRCRFNVELLNFHTFHDWNNYQNAFLVEIYKGLTGTF